MPLSLCLPSSILQKLEQCVLKIVDSGCVDCSSGVGWCVPHPSDLQYHHLSIVLIDDLDARCASLLLIWGGVSGGEELA